MSVKFENDEHPEDKTLCGFQILLRWVNPLVQLANQRPLTDDDVWNSPKRDRVHQLSSQFWEQWYLELDSCNNNGGAERSKSPSLVRVLFKTFGWRIFLGGCCQFIFLLFQIGQPFLVGQLVQYIQTGNGGIRVGIGYALGFAGLSLCSSIALSITLDNLRRLGVSIRSVLMIAIYEQALRLTTAARLQNTIGQTTNLMSIDAEKLNLAVQFIHFLWHGPLVSLIIVIIFIFEIGYAPALAGMAFLCLLFPLQNFVAKKIGKIRQKMVKLTDERVKLINEMLQSIRVIKLYAWEAPLEKRVNAVRDKETSTLHRYLDSAGQLRELIFSAQPISALIIFVTATYGMKDPLTVAQIFRVIAFLNITRFPLNLLGQAMKNVSDGLVSIERLNRFFLLPTLQNVKHREIAENPHIELVDATFSWQDQAAEKLPVPSDSKAVLSSNTRKSELGQIELVIVNSHENVTQEVSDPVPLDRSYFQLNEVNFTTNRPNELIAIIGSVGCGKSSFMSALLGEMNKVSGKCNVSGTLSFCSQTPWIQNITLKQNIVFEFDQNSLSPEMNLRYRNSLDAAALLPDIAILPSGDMTEIGERGINLSGGQKSRVSLARAFFSSYRSQICLFDDPFSAVDGNTGNQIFQKGVLKLLNDKLRIIALNSHMHLLKYFDRIIVLENGKISADGSLSELFKQNSSLMTKITGLSVEHFGEGVITINEPVEKSNDPLPTTDQSEVVLKVKDEAGNTRDVPPPKKEKKLISEEKADSGISTLVAYVKYFSASLHSVERITSHSFYSSSSLEPVFSWALIFRGMMAIFLMVLIFGLSQLLRVFVDLYLAKYVKHYDDGNDPHLYKDLYFSAFGIFIFTVLIRSYYLNVYSVRSSKVLHAYILRRILSAPIPSFFDTHTIGSVLNRFSKDIETVDVNIPEFMLQSIINWFQVISIFALCIWASYWFVIIMVPLGFGYYRVYLYFSKASKSLKQLESVSRSPIYSLLSETLYGLETIRAYGDTDRFLKLLETRLNRNHKLMYHSSIVASWMTVRLELSTSLILLTVALLTVSIRDNVSPISLGLALSYGLQLTALFQRCIQLLIEITNYMNSTERVLEYLDKPQEINLLTESSSTDLSVWPKSGSIELIDVWMQYRDNPPILRGLSFFIHGGERVGVCGRTGAGKSSVMMALFRIVEITRGTIKIDGVDIASIPLTTLRSHLAIIPQDPVLFTGNVRFQLDPFQQYSDLEIWGALEQVCLADVVKSMPQGLNESVAENGENLSQGQRQLICIARALLRKAKVLIVDEGTSAVDPHTDELIQKVLRYEASVNGTTVLAIAHRLQTIVDFDRILVLGDGKVLEFDSPQALLADSASTFSRMMKEANIS